MGTHETSGGGFFPEWCTMTNSNVLQLTELVNTEDPWAVLEEVRIISESIFPGFDFTFIRGAFVDTLRLFSGHYPGYRACNVCYHDLQHTTDIFLAMTRLIHGAFLHGMTFSERHYNLAVVSALMHDTGYVQTESDTEGSGAKHTLSHISRSVDFLHVNFAEAGFSEEDFIFCTNCLNCTGLDTHINQISFTSNEEEMLGKMLGTADLLGQMADRWYLEKLPFLYYEFVEGGVPGYASVLDLLRKTPTFYEYTMERFSTQLSDVYKFMRYHFKARWDIDKDLYLETVERNITYLKHVVLEHETDYHLYLRRGRYMELLKEKITGID